MILFVEKFLKVSVLELRIELTRGLLYNKHVLVVKDILFIGSNDTVFVSCYFGSTPLRHPVSRTT